MKNKSFEAIFRASQLGGEQAKVRMVSFLANDDLNNDWYSKENNIEKLKHDFQQYDAIRNCKFFGLDDVKNDAFINELF